MSTPLTERLYLRDARAKTALAQVSGHASGGFTLDRTVYHATDARYHHAQPCDRGHLLADGHKLKVHKVGFDGKGRLVHRTDGPLPSVGARAQLHLDAPRREQQARAHTLMHLLVEALAESRAELLAQPEVVGGGEVKLLARFRERPEDGWAKVAARAKQLVDARLDVTPTWMPRDESARVCFPQALPLAAIAPDEPTLRIVRIGERGLPCDAPLVSRSYEVGEFRVAPVQPARDGTRLRVRIV